MMVKVGDGGRTLASRSRLLLTFAGISLIVFAASSPIESAARGPEVTVPGPVSAVGGIASPDCSKATARQLVERNNLNHFALPDPVRQVLCGTFTGLGSNAMAVTIGAPTCWPIQHWAVFRLTEGVWRLVLNQPAYLVPPLVAVGSDIRETTAAHRPGDPRCFPSGGTRARIWHWYGSRLVAGPWKQVKAGTAAPPAAGGTSGYFKTPSTNVVCGYRLYTGSSATTSFVGCRIKSGLKPPPPGTKPGCFSRNEVAIAATGRTSTGRSICPGEPEGDAGVFVFESQARVLGYGKTWSGGGLRCTSAVIGLTCRNNGGHGFFLSRERWRAF